jgi:glycosyltransferase involved in cell wall biosynthesis
VPRPPDRERLRVAWWGPLAPSPSVTAWQSELLLPELSAHHDVTTVTALDDAPSDVDVHVYNLECDLEVFGPVHDAALRRPGIVVLHEYTLLPLYRQRYDDEQLEAEVRWCYGDLADLGLRLEAACAPDGDPLDLPLLRRVCETSRAVVVHDMATRDDLARRFPLVPVWAVAPASSRSRRRPPHEQSTDRLRVAVVGAVERRRLAAAAARAVGRAGLEVELVEPSLGVDDWLGDVDLVVDLTRPATGGARRETVEAAQAGLPAVVAASRHAPDPGRGIRTIPLAPADVIRELCTVFAAVARGDAGTGADLGVGSSMSPAAPARTVALHYDALLREVATRTPDRPAEPAAVVGNASVGVNLIGDFDATTGLMEAGRRLLRSMVAAGVSVQLQTHVSAAGSSRTRRTSDSDRLPRGRQHDLEVLLLNVNEMSSVKDSWLRPPGTDRYVIGAWFWELGELTEDLSRHTQRVDEVWVASEFVRSAFRGAFRGPVTLVPPAVEPLVPPHFDAAQFGIREASLVFFFNFDALSTAARKNPWGVVDAFARAFSADERASTVQLVIKVHNLERVPGLAAPLAAAIAGVDGLLIDAELSRSEMNGLLGRCDVYASLHRSEGFGLGMAEAMYLGKPVIATAYSGNIDFTLPTTSCLVGYRMRPVTSHDHRHYPEAVDLYPSGLVWAEPDVDAAARWMRLLADTPALRARVGAAGAREIRARYSPRAQQAAVVARLDALRDEVRGLGVEPERGVDELEVPLCSGAH